MVWSYTIWIATLAKKNNVADWSYTIWIATLADHLEVVKELRETLVLKFAAVLETLSWRFVASRCKANE